MRKIIQTTGKIVDILWTVFRKSATILILCILYILLIIYLPSALIAFVLQDVPEALNFFLTLWLFISSIIAFREYFKRYHDWEG